MTGIAAHDYVTDLKPAPGKWLGFMGFSVFSALVGLTRLNSGSSLLGGILMIWATMGGVVAAVALFSKRMVLRLTPEGFSFGTLHLGIIFNAGAFK